MAIPEFQDFMLPVLTFLKDGQEHSSQELYSRAAEYFGLSEDDKRESLPSGREPRYINRTSWARTFLSKAGLIETPRRGYAKITKEGLSVLKQQPKRVDNKFLSNYPQFVEFRNPKKDDEDSDATNVVMEADRTPKELVESGITSLTAELGVLLLDELLKTDPYYFEHIVTDLLQALGYGETHVTKRSNDGGIDAIVNEDKLGLDRILIQAKRYGPTNPVAIKDIRDFVGTLDLNGVSKGIFITTSTYPSTSKDILRGTQKSVILIDGGELSRLMIANNIGVSIEREFAIKRLDTDYFNPA